MDVEARLGATTLVQLVDLVLSLRQEDALEKARDTGTTTDNLEEKESGDGARSVRQ